MPVFLLELYSLLFFCRHKKYC